MNKNWDSVVDILQTTWYGGKVSELRNEREVRGLGWTFRSQFLTIVLEILYRQLGQATFLVKVNSSYG